MIEYSVRCYATPELEFDNSNDNQFDDNHSSWMMSLVKLIAPLFEDFKYCNLKISKL